MRTNSSDTKDILLLMFLASFLVALLFVWLILVPNWIDDKGNEVANSQTLETKQLLGKTQEFSIRGYKFKTTTVCLEEKEMIFVFHKGEPQIVNLNKDCGEIK